MRNRIEYCCTDGVDGIVGDGDVGGVESTTLIRIIYNDKLRRWKTNHPHRLRPFNINQLYTIIYIFDIHNW